MLISKKLYNLRSCIIFFKIDKDQLIVKIVQKESDYKTFCFLFQVLHAYYTTSTYWGGLFKE